MEAWCVTDRPVTANMLCTEGGRGNVILFSMLHLNCITRCSVIHNITINQPDILIVQNIANTYISIHTILESESFNARVMFHRSQKHTAVCWRRSEGSRALALVGGKKMLCSLSHPHILLGLATMPMALHGR